MKVIKRNGDIQDYSPEKISKIFKLCFSDAKKEVDPETLEKLLKRVKSKLPKGSDTVNVSEIHDSMEKVLLEGKFWDEAKYYIIHRYKKTESYRSIESIVTETGCDSLRDTLESVSYDFPEPAHNLEILADKFSSFIKPGMGVDEKLDTLTKCAVELTTAEAPGWEFISARIFCFQILRDIDKKLGELGILDYPSKVDYLVSQDLMGDYIQKTYTREELAEAHSFIDRSRNNLLNYSGLKLLSDRYIIKTYDKEFIESPQEMWLGIALHLAIPEKPENRMHWVKKFYDIISKLEVTMATPTTSNARKPHHQLSSCFIDTVPDSLNGIYRSLTNFAKVSKEGGGFGAWMGSVRASGSDIRGHKGASGGIIGWLRSFNDTAVSVNQLGTRAGSIACYIPVWHKDLLEFLSVRTNNGDDRMKAHDIFTGVCYPDLFWKMAEGDLNQPWYLFCPHEIRKHQGYSLEDFNGPEWETKYKECILNKALPRKKVTVKDIVRLVIKSSVETGQPFLFNSDTVQEANPNKHAGKIYCSNLCTEIAQNQSPIEEGSETINPDGSVTETVKPGDFVICNLASLTLGRLPLNEDREYLRDVIRTVIRAMDNVIDLNYYPLKFAEITSHKYRALGLGAAGLHHALAVRGIKWESEDHLRFGDSVFEYINYCAIEASSDLAAEKGSYSMFQGSEWQTGKYFERRGYNSQEWLELKSKVATQGMRNGYLLAVAPNGSSSIFSGTTATCDPVHSRFFLEEKKGAMLPRLAPELNDKTWWMYKSAYNIDQSWTIRAAGIRQRHIDQAQSMNLYITQDYSMRQILDLYILAWRSGVKTIYYTRSKSLEAEECETCSA